MEAEICALAPSDWRIRSVEDVCKRVTSGGTPSRARPDFYVDGSWPWVKTQELQDTWIDHTEEKITDEAVANSSAKVLPPNTILLAMYGATVGQLGILRSPMTCNQACCAMIVDPEKADFRYLYHHLRHSRTQLKNLATGAAQQNLSGALIKSLHYPFPPLAEQKAIAAVLGELDDKIELNRRMNATLEAMAQTLFQSWFVDFDPVRAKLDNRPPAALDPATAALFPASFQDSPLGHIPTGWEAIPLYDTAQWVNGAAFKNEDFCAIGEGLPVIKIAELKDGISAQTKWCQRDAGADKIIDTGDLVYSWSGSPDTSLEAFLWSGGRGLLNQHIFKVISPAPAEKRFVYYLLQYLRPVLVETARNKQTTGLGHVTIADMKRLLVCRPSKAMLAAFDRKVAPIFDKAFTNTLESRTLATLRDTLLPKLLSGELSVDNFCPTNNPPIR
jgi:type I restriction enzyme S subunit